MNTRIPHLRLAVVLALAAAGIVSVVAIALAGDDDPGASGLSTEPAAAQAEPAATPSPTPSPTETAEAVEPAPVKTATYEAGEAGSVTVAQQGDTLRVEAVTATSGWTSETEWAAGREVEVQFESPDRSRRVDFKAEYQDGEVRVRVRTRDGSSGDNSAAHGSRDDHSHDDRARSGDDNPSPGEDNPQRLGADDSVGHGAGSSRPKADEVGERDGRRETRTFVELTSSETYQAAGAGTVTVARDGDTLRVAGVSAASGWASVIERASGREVEVKFRTDDRVHRVDFAAQLEGGSVRIKVREREG